MARKYSDSELVEKINSPGWEHVERESGNTTPGSLAESLKVAHQHNAEGEHPGLIREIETTVELDMLQLAMLWRQLGLPV
jgi:hypothetical protein